MGSKEMDTLLAKLAATPRRRPPLHLLGTKRFELRRQLGSGAFGDVYEARDREYGTIVALKSLKSSHPDWIYRFKREFRIVGDLAHPNLVRLYELFLEDERWYLTMELIEGLRFDDHVRRAPDQLRSCFGQLALGISELHRANCLHRDLKPSNALVEPTGRVVLLDFGLALHKRATNSAVAGTPPFMAPELGLGRAPSAAGDWYAFGVMLYYALAGELPFTGSDIEILNKKLGPPPKRPSLLRADVDPVLEVLALRLLAKDPALRPGPDEIMRELVGSEISVELGQRERRPLAGRQRELDTLAAALATSASQPVVVTVRGQPGLGKTSLVTTFLESIRATTQVYQGRCLELESVPFKGIDGAIDMLCNDLRHRRFQEAAQLMPDDTAALAQMFPMIKRVEAFARHAAEPRVRSPQEVRQAASEALRSLFGKLAERVPVVLFDDDLQWSSDDSVRLLLELLRAPAPRLLLIVAYREESGGIPPPVERFVAGLAELGITRVDIPVEPLDTTGIAELLASHGDVGLSPGEALRETGGHPYLMMRLLDHGGHFDGPIELTTVLAGELAQLDTSGRQLLEVVSIAGGPISQRVAFEAAGLRLDPATVDQLRRRRLIHGATSNLEAYHDRVRDIALAELSEERRRDLHARIASALETSGLAEPETLARHYRHAHDRARALAWTRRAAKHAADTLAFGRAVELAIDAVSLAADDNHRLQLLEELAAAQVEAGRRNDAGESCLQAAELARQIGAASQHAALQARAGEHFLLAGQLERGLELLRDALAAVGVNMPVSPAVAVAESFNVGGVLATRGLAFQRRPADTVDPQLLQRIDLQLAVTRSLVLTDLRAPLLATRALLDALAAGETTRVQRALALFVISNAARSPEDPIVVQAEESAVELAEELDDELAVAWAQLAFGLRATQVNQFPYALYALRLAERLFLVGSLSHARESTFARVLIATVCGNYGVDLAYARDQIARVEEEALARGDLFGATWAQLTHCFVALSGNDPRTARTNVTNARSSWPRAFDSLFAAMCMIYELAVEQYEDPAGSLSVLARIEPEFRQLFTSLIPFPRAMFCRMAACTVMCAWQEGRLDHTTATRRIAELLEEMTSTPTRPAHLHVLQSHERALAGDTSGQIAQLEKAADDWDGTQQRALALTARLRAQQLRGDAAQVRAVERELGELTIVDPDRFAVLLVGPRPPS